LHTDYQESIEGAAQVVRAALPLANKYKLPANPITYAILYEYILGKNTELKASVEDLFKHHNAIDAKDFTALYNTFLVDNNEEAMVKTRQALLALLASTQKSLQEAGKDSQSYSESLNNAVDDLQGGGDISTATNAISRLIDETSQMQASSQTLQDELSKSNRDLAELQTEFERVRHESMVDPLTGIQNRRAFDDALAECCSQTKIDQQPLCLLIIDIDHFKKVNDTYGHVVGDAVLKCVSSALNKTIRGGDLLARYGGEEFVVVLPMTPMEGAERVADNICNIVRNQAMDKNQVGDNVGRVTVSVGVALFSEAESTEEFVARADTALYRAKESGRNRVCTHTVT